MLSHEKLVCLQLLPHQHCLADALAAIHHLQIAAEPQCEHTLNHVIEACQLGRHRQTDRHRGNTSIGNTGTGSVIASKKIGMLEDALSITFIHIIQHLLN